MQSYMIYILVISLILLMALVIAPIHITFIYKRKQEDDLLTLKMALWKFPPYVLQVPMMDLKTRMSGIGVKWGDEDDKNQQNQPGIRNTITTLLGLLNKENKVDGKISEKVHIPYHKIHQHIDRVLKLYKRYWPVAKYLLRRVKCKHFEWRTEFGTGDAASTGWVTGMAWAVKTAVVSQMFRFIQVPKSRPILEIHPNFNRPLLGVRIHGEFNVRIIFIIITGVKMLLSKKIGSTEKFIS